MDKSKEKKFKIWSIHGKWESPDLESARRPVPYNEEIPVPVCTTLADISMSEVEEIEDQYSNSIENSQYAAKYLAMVRHAIAGPSSKPIEEADYQQSELFHVKEVDSQQSKQLQASSGNSSEPNLLCKLWKTSHATEDDNKATLTLLSLRKSMDSQFSDKKIHKNELWKRIAEKINQMGFYVGIGIEGREKGKLKVPKFYEEMEDILGDKHKVNPIMNIDSLNVIKSTNNSECITIQEAEAQSCCTSTSIFDDSTTSDTLSDVGNSTPSSSNQFKKKSLHKTNC
ncbi:unnamed protein product [Psylliodes chrysocephalus]|uniref:Uncharacterized protein n=1 Tax=Psylliodes chrysocephalus TaxID=3402493 RepID=A0A9P0G835_9CUCU|nr:unnamed protein product [Psylliodes chrysocephala]